jgi:4-aminobutyrate aminotransferase-like enzyme
LQLSPPLTILRADLEKAISIIASVIKQQTV